ncbi:hypothetical protein CROQUDRAFT_685992 [Cronartium quercuum f. sp. fusiforme G11]|uniref:Uncharacterized protein n=1 Tax=Cronartium quercuum f. sp. fusiforme G11 TaxID=708437 RepID=A0A9P6N822_9BASI|nr:hypothetical protein CROQUDRAFT_685992 [Cronartium quercuum f. sp. fusiforme G11]
MSKCFPVDFVIVAVSPHLSDFAFQYMPSTPGLWSWVEQDQVANPLATTAAKMQASQTGVSVGGLQAAALATVDMPRISHYPESKTANANSKWPWLKCETRLTDLGLTLVHLPGANSSLKLFTRASNLLTEPTAKLIDQDFANGLVSLADIPGHVQTAEQHICKRKRKRSLVAVSDDLTETEAAGDVPNFAPGSE